MLNGVNVHYIKINLKTYVDKIFEPYFDTWMKTAYPTPARATPLPSDPSWHKKIQCSN
jgi:hypothetical protein